MLASCSKTWSQESFPFPSPKRANGDSKQACSVSNRYMHLSLLERTCFAYTEQMYDDHEQICQEIRSTAEAPSSRMRR